MPQAARWLIDQHISGGAVDLSDFIVVTNVGLAGRRLLELLVEQAEKRQAMLSPPTITTVGRLPELLYRPKWPFADAFVQRLAWARALQESSDDTLAQIVARPPEKGDVLRWLDLGEVLRLQHIELAADLLDFGQVASQGAAIPGFQEADRWRALYEVQTAYWRLLDSLELWDRQTARLVALEKNEYATEKQIVMLGAVDLNRTMRKILDHVSDRVTIVIHAPERLADRFDEHGCLHPGAWEEAPIDLQDDKIVPVDGPADQAEAVAAKLAEWAAAYSADEISVGLPDESLASQVERRLAESKVASRWIGGRVVGDTGPAQLLLAAAAFLETGKLADLSALVRHSDVYSWLRSKLHLGCFLTDLDEYACKHLGSRRFACETDNEAGDIGQGLSEWLGDEKRSQKLAKLEAAVEELLAGLRGVRPVQEFQAPLRDLLLAVYGGRPLDVNQTIDRINLEACSHIATAMERLASAPSALLPRAPASQVLRWIYNEVAAEAVPPEENLQAVHLLGWLELPLDDAPALIVTTFNERFVPSSRMGDAFLPDMFRRRLGLDDSLRRYARDAYALNVLVASREKLALIVGRRDAEGNPLTPSRLLFATDDQRLAERAERLFGEPPSPPASVETPPPVAPRTPSKWYGFPTPRPSPLAPIESIRVTDFKEYLKCPYRFYLGRLLKLEPLNDAAVELDGRAFGTLAHRALAAFGTSEGKDWTDARQVAALLEEILEELATAQFGRRRSPVVLLQLAQLRARFKTFAQWQAQRAAEGWSIQHVEFEAKEEVSRLVVDGQPIVLKGTIDRIDFHPEKGHAVFDYKTSDSGESPHKTHRPRGQWIDLQLPLYRHIGLAMDFQPDKLQLGYIVLPRDTKKDPLSPANWTAEELQEAQHTAWDVVRKVRNHEFWPMSAIDSRLTDDFAAICKSRCLGSWSEGDDDNGE